MTLHRTKENRKSSQATANFKRTIHNTANSKLRLTVNSQDQFQSFDVVFNLLPTTSFQNGRLTPKATWMPTLSPRKQIRWTSTIIYLCCIYKITNYCACKFARLLIRTETRLIISEVMCSLWWQQSVNRLRSWLNDARSLEGATCSKATELLFTLLQQFQIIDRNCRSPRVLSQDLTCFRGFRRASDGGYCHGMCVCVRVCGRARVRYAFDLLSSLVVSVRAQRDVSWTGIRSKTSAKSFTYGCL